MNLIRRRLAVLVMVVAVCQCAGVMAASAILCCRMESTAAAGDDESACTCGHGAGAECPLHQNHGGRRSEPVPRSPADCRCSGVPDGAATMLTTLVSLAGPLVDRSQVAVPEGSSRFVSPASAPVLSLARPPVSPPPRD